MITYISTKLSIKSPVKNKTDFKMLFIIANAKTKDVKMITLARQTEVL